MNPRYPLVALRAKNRCEYCRAPQTAFNFEFEVEHIVPTSQGGADSEDNLSLACHGCNRMKSDRTQAKDPVSDQEVCLFHPRQHRWEDHFTFGASSGIVVGLTEIGRATIELLKMNRELQVQARQIWIQLGLFP
jgi:hypothetical protein